MLHRTLDDRGAIGKHRLGVTPVSKDFVESTQKVVFRDDADDLAVFRHGYPAEAALSQDLNDLDQLRTRADRHDIGHHDVFSDEIQFGVAFAVADGRANVPI